MSNLNYVSSSPHVRSNESTDSVMRDVIIALIPATMVGFYIFGMAGIVTVLLSMVFCVGFEALYQIIAKQKVTVRDGSAAVTGLLLGLNLPASMQLAEAPFLGLFAPMIGALVAIVLVKQLFGGLGYNFMNPALAARAFLIVSFAEHMTTFPYVNTVKSADVVSSASADTVSSATVLGILKDSEVVEPSVLDTFLGNMSGSIGEISAIALIIGGLYLIGRKVITYHIPTYFIGTVAIFVAVYGVANGVEAPLEFVGYHLFSGGLMIGAFFMATDYVTSPMTKKGQVIFAIGCGVITSAIRLVGSYPEGVSFAILIMNLVVPLIDRYTIPRAFGEEK